MTSIAPMEDDAEPVAGVARAQGQPAAQLMVEAHDVVKTYLSGQVRTQALRGVSLEVPKGEMVAIMGPSGCGKTTLLNCLSGLDSYEGGRILIEGSDLSRL